MADLPYINQAQEVKITGQSTAGATVNYVTADANGNLAVNNYANGPVSPGTVAAVSGLIGGQYNSAGVSLTNTQQSAVQLDSSGRVLTNVGSTAPPNNLVATGTLTGTSQTVTLTLQGTASINVDVSGPGFVGTITVLENTPSSGRLLGVFALNNSSIASSITTNGNYRVVGIPTSGTISVQFSSYTSGSATINIYGSTAPYIVQPYSANAANVLVTSYLNDGVGNSIASINSQLEVADIVNTALSSGSLAVSTTAVACRVGASNLTNRKMLIVAPIGGNAYLGATSGVTTSTGIPIYAGSIAQFAFSANVTPYIVAASSITVNVMEGS